MKKIGFVFTLVLALFVCGVYAAEESTVNTLLDSSYIGKTNIIDKPVVLPSNIHSFANFIFGLKGVEISFSVFIILVVLFIALFSIIQLGVSLIPIFRDNFARYAVAISITLLASIFGTLKDISGTIFGIALGIRFFGENNTLAGLLLALFLLVAVTFGLYKLITYVKSQYKIADAEKSAISLVNELLRIKKQQP